MRLRTLTRQLSRALSIYGPVETVRRGVVRLMSSSRQPEPTSAFDTTHSVDTDGNIDLRTLTLVGDRDAMLYGIRYQPIHDLTLREMLDSITIPAGCTFADIGCGKGRALLIAADYPFARVLGIDYAPDLVAIAKQNCASRPIEVICADATSHPLPDGPLVLFLYNPFIGPVLARFVAHLQRRIASDPRVTILYRFAEHPDAFATLLPSIVRTERYVICANIAHSQ